MTPAPRPRRRAAVLLVALAAGLALAACAGPVRAPGGTAATPGTPAGADALTGDLTIMAAASLQPAFDQLVEEFAALHPGVDVAPVTYDGSSTLATQLVEGATADVLASASEATMADVTAAGLAPSPQVFATNSPQIVVAAGNPEDVGSLADLARLADEGGVVVLCAPEVPCGAAAHAALDAAGVALTPTSEEQNVTAVLTKVTSGEADAGVVYVTDVRHAGSAVTGVAVDDAPVTRYPIAVLAGDAVAAGHDPAVARAFTELVTSARGQEVLRSFGFGAP